MSEQPAKFEPEAKALQWTWEDFPPDILQAMLDKSEHPQIYRHGRVDQIYLDTQKQEIFDRVLEALYRKGFRFDEDQLALANPQLARELRLLSKPDLRKKQLTIKGHPTSGGISCPQLETPDDKDSTRLVQEIIDEEDLMNPKIIRGTVGKVWHDIRAKVGDEERVVEHDILTSHSDLMVVETEVNVVDERDAVAEIEKMIAEKRLPPWFQTDVTSRRDIKNSAASYRVLDKPQLTER